MTEYLLAIIAASIWFGLALIDLLLWRIADALEDIARKLRP